MVPRMPRFSMAGLLPYLLIHLSYHRVCGNLLFLNLVPDRSSPVSRFQSTRAA